MEPFIIKALQLILSLSILIIAHECGHFFFARLFKVRVEKFYLFFNPSFSLFRMKKINGKWKFRWFSKNDSNTKKQYNYKGEEETVVISAEELADNNWKKYPETTEYGIGWLPLGGYVKIAGMIDESMDTEQMKKPAQPWEFRSKKSWQRLVVMVAGVTVNFILAFLIYSAVLFTWGETYVDIKDTPMMFSEAAINAGFQDGDRIIEADGVELDRLSDGTLLAILEAKEVTVIRGGNKVTLQMPEKGLIRDILKDENGFLAPYLPAVVDSVMPGNPAAYFLQRNDQFVAINDTVNIRSFFDLTAFLQTNEEKTLQVTLLRNGDTITQDIPLNEEGKFGFSLKQIVRVQEYSFWQSIPAGFSYGVNKLTSYVRQMKFLFTPEGMSNLSGIGGIGSMFPAAWDWHRFWENTAFISIVLAFLNILPIPALDGGHVVFLLYEMITRRKPSVKFMTYAQMIGMLILFSLFFWANGMDVFRFFSK